MSPVFITKSRFNSINATRLFVAAIPSFASTPCCLITSIACLTYSVSGFSSGPDFKICASSKSYRSARKVARLWKWSNPRFCASGRFWNVCEARRGQHESLRAREGYSPSKNR